MEDVVFELLRPLDERERMRGDRMTRAANQTRDLVMRRRLSPKPVKRRIRRRRGIQKPSQLA